MTRLPLWVAAFGVCVSLCAADDARLEGTVRDVSGARAPQTVVTCLQEETGFRFSTISNGIGEYRFAVPEGHYKIVARHAGFRATARLDILAVAGKVRHVDFTLEPGSTFETITVRDSAEPSDLNRAGSTTLPLAELAGSPLNDRTVSGLLRFSAGILITPANSGDPGQFSSLGARPSSNIFLVDGISANNAVSGAGWPSLLASGNLPAMTALGTTHNLALLDSIDDVRVETQDFSAGPGHVAGAAVLIRTRSGSNEFHGSSFYSGRPSVLASTDWFSNTYNLGRNVSTLNDFGGSLGGPLQRDRTFFFLAAERLDLRQRYAWITTVPSLTARYFTSVSAPLQALLDEFPLPNGPALAFGIGELVGSSSQPSGLVAVNARIDHALTTKTHTFLRLAFTPSSTEGGLTELDRTQYQDAVAALGVTRTGSAWIEDTRLSFSRNRASSTWAPGGQTPAPSFYSQFPSFAADFSTITVGGAGSVTSGQDGRNQEGQLEASWTATRQASGHTLSLGADFLNLRPSRNAPASDITVAFGSPISEFSGPPAPVWATQIHTLATSVTLPQLSLFAQDNWRINPRLSVTYGVRALWSRTPSIAAQPGLYALSEMDGTVNAAPLTSAASLWHGWPVRLDPVLAAAWRLRRQGDTILRVSWTTFHDNWSDSATVPLNGVPYRSVSTPLGNLNLLEANLGYGFLSSFRLPVYQRWNVAVEHAFNRHDSISISYSGIAGVNELRPETSLAVPNLAALSFASNDGKSIYNSLNFIYRRSLARGLQGSLAYSWSHSIDLGSSDTALFALTPGVPATSDRGDSDFDVRQTLSGQLSYALPLWNRFGWLGRLASRWTLGTFVSARTGFPIDIQLTETVDGLAIENNRPAFTLGQPIWISGANAPPTPAGNVLSAPGGWVLNRSAFALPGVSPAEVLGRNAVRGFGMWQADMSIERPIKITESMRLSLRVESYNALNHALFADPLRYLSNPLFGYAQSPLALMLGSGSPGSGASPAFELGGPRSFQVSLRVQF
ncbi:MAG TPA: TonB-dependent receptor [Bryobacteraceae bacterium]|nr:TonB-dependent receptor [Bryobacteraceae bacterium]